MKNDGGAATGNVGAVEQKDNGKLEIVRILVRKYLVLFGCTRQCLREIEEIMNQP
jgi:hypothetical protein